MTLKQLAALHGVNETSLRIWLRKEAKIKPSNYKVIKGIAVKCYDREAAAAVATFLKGRPRRGVGRPPKTAIQGEQNEIQ